MSDIQDTQRQTSTITSLSVTQKMVQQRQILAMMGIGQWVQPDSLTLNIADIAANNLPLVSAPVIIEDALDSNLESNHQIVETLTEQASSTNTVEGQNIARDDEIKPTSVAVTDYRFDSIDPVEPLVEPAVAPLLAQATTSKPHSYHADKDELILQDKVAPFDLQGGLYGRWVLMVDIQALDSDSQKLWQNIVQALSLDCETTSFPICAGMDTAELANASLAGYLFRIGRSEEIQVAALTEIPKGLTHPNLADTPTLSEMLADSTLKRKLWQQISN